MNPSVGTPAEGPQITCSRALNCLSGAVCQELFGESAIQSIKVEWRQATCDVADGIWSEGNKVRVAT